MTRRPHIPHDLPPDGIDWEKLISLIGEANRKIAEIPNRITVNSLLRKLSSEGLIKVLIEGRGSRPSVYVLPELINIVEGREIL